MSEGEVLPKLLAAVGLWPPAGWESPWPRKEVARLLEVSAKELDVRGLTVLLWIATVLGPRMRR